MYKPSPSHQKFLDILTEKNRPKKTANLMDEYLGDQREYQKAVDDGFQGTYEEFLRMKSMRENVAYGGRMGYKLAGPAKKTKLKTTAKNLSKVKNYLDQKTFVKLRKENKNLTNDQFAKYLNEQTNYIPDPRQAEKFQGISIDRRYNAAKKKGLFPKTFAYAGSDKTRLITDKDRAEYKKYVKKLYKNKPEKVKEILALDDKAINKKISDRRKTEKVMADFEKRQKKNDRKRKYDFETKTGLRGEEAQRVFFEKTNERNRLRKKDANTFFRNLRNGKSLLWEDLLKRTSISKDPPFKLDKKIIKRKKYKKEETQKLVLTDKNGNKFRYDSLLEDIAKAGYDPQNVLRPYEQKAFLYRENLMKPIIENADKVLGARDNPIHIHHLEGFNKNPFNVQLTFADQNLMEGRNRVSLNATFNNLLKQEKIKSGSNLSGLLNYNRKKQALTKFYDSLGPDIATQVGKKEVGTRPSLIDMLKKKNIKMSPDIKQRAAQLGYVDRELLEDIVKGAKKATGATLKAAAPIAKGIPFSAGIETFFIPQYQEQGYTPKEIATQMLTGGMGIPFKDVQEKARYVKERGLGSALTDAFNKKMTLQNIRPSRGLSENFGKEPEMSRDEKLALKLYYDNAQDIINARRKIQADKYKRLEEMTDFDDEMFRDGAMNGGIMKLLKND